MNEKLTTLTTDRLDLFDDGLGYDDDRPVRLAPGLTEMERKQASALYYLFNELWGVCIVKGDPGSGKDTFGNWLAYMCKRYYPWKRILRDERPRTLFGEYDGLFNEYVLSSDLAKMREIAKGVGFAQKGGVLEKAADDWVTAKGAVMLQNSVLYLTEYYRYCYNREPHNPMNKTMGGIHKMKRHLDCFIIGTIQLPSELDTKTCLPWVDWQVTCVKSKVNPTGFTFFVEGVKYEPRSDLLVPTTKPFAIPLDAGKPRKFIGDGKIIIRKPDYKPETEEERIILDVLKAGLDDYDEIVELLETDGDMSEYETLATLKELRFGKRAGQLKYVIDYPCYFAIFNSKSAPQLYTKLGGG